MSRRDWVYIESQRWLMKPILFFRGECSVIYVDELREYPNGKWCHMWTDGDVEALHTFAAKLGLKREWLHESRGISGEFRHYDLRPNLRTLALECGAKYKPLKQWIAERAK